MDEPSRQTVALRGGPVGEELDRVCLALPDRNLNKDCSAWSTFLSLLDDSTGRHKLFSLLSIAQVNSLRLLEEWWHWRCDDAKKADVVAFDRTMHLNRGDVTYNYHKLLYDLWLWEFNSYHEVVPHYQGNLEDALSFVRQNAATVAAGLRVGLAAYEAIRRAPDQENPVTLSDRNVVEKATEQPSSKKWSPYAQAHVENRLPACIDPCHWVGDQRFQKNYPYYLWDKEEKRTIHFDVDIPQYSVISHTWGRFRLKDQEVEIPGVQWRVPCLDPDQLFDVKFLPEILSNFPLPTRYLWLDLVCIPQDGRPLQDIEIGRQAGIFTTATFAVVWFNRLNGWEGLEAALMWSGIKYLSYDADDAFGTKQYLSQMSNEAMRPCGLTRPANSEIEGTPKAAWVFQDQNEETVTPDPWFTSLWTLQESCLRPDMVLCDKNWNILSLGEADTQFPILLDHIVALFESLGPLKLKVPASVHELLLLLNSSNLRTLLRMKPVDILILGDMRYCANTDRALAIMSALGATKWHDRRSNHNVDSRPEDLVLGKFQLQFLKECLRRFGAIMFATLNVYALDDTFYEAAKLDAATVTDLQGSLMPFSRGVLDPRYLHVLLVSVEDHPTVQNWSIQADGSVRMSEVCVMASIGDGNTRPIYVDVLPSRRKFRMDRTGMQQDELYDWMSSFRPDSDKYAVCLLRNMKNSLWGVLLERLHPGEDLFVNVGIWYTPEEQLHDHNSRCEFPTTVSVDWRVV
ncbi:hypothetical protein EJ04DRAFT_524581 [Polyplosphaeria fusca]|uniref:Heterokaryon incompatibility domain-containing protein n=1 Tax=Polyplosphaeria fusca TaxID=682080 RepID=A0A9P4QYL4_9PLEO|nr:hypothetical protein EJ04DRAFT_524581 [Polyplosphaeria fusca]